MLFVTPFKTSVTGAEGKGPGVGAGVGFGAGGRTASPDFFTSCEAYED